MREKFKNFLGIVKNKLIRSEEFKLFIKDKKLKNNNTYFSVDPMPKLSEIENFYKFDYKKNMNFRNTIIDERAILHFKFIEKMKLNFNNFLNIGSNTGGISHLLRVKGKKIYNYDFFEVKKYYNENWNYVSNLNSIKDKIDLIYLSHSLEHIIDFWEFFLNLNQIMSEDCYVFIEVPNGTNEKAGGLKKIIPPHLHYFKKEFFKNLNRELIELNLTNKKKTDQKEINYSDDKDYKFIVYLGKGKFNTDKRVQKY